MDHSHQPLQKQTNKQKGNSYNSIAHSQAIAADSLAPHKEPGYLISSYIISRFLRLEK